MTEKNRESLLDLLRSIVKNLWSIIPTFAFWHLIIKIDFAPAVILTGAIFIIQAVFDFLSWYNKIFYVEDNVLYYNTGAFNKKTLEIPLDMIMGIAIKEDFSEKLFFLRTLIIDRGISGEEEIKLTLKRDNAFVFRNRLLKDKVITDTKKQTDENIIYKIGKRDLFLFALINKSYILLFSFVVSMGFTLSELGIAKMLNGLEFNYLIVILIFVLLLAINFCIGLIRFYGFTVRKKDKILEISRGFFNRKISSVNIANICGINTSQTVLQRCFNKSTLSVSTLGFNDEAGATIVFPMADENRLAELQLNLFPKFNYTGKKHRIHKRYKLRYKNARYGYDVKLLYLCGGFFKKKTATILTDEVDCIKCQQYSWQRTDNICKLKVRYKAMKFSDLKKMKGVPMHSFDEISNIIIN